MSLFQILLLALAACLFTGSLVATIKGWLTRREGLVWTLVWLTAGVTVAWPGVTAIVARALGIGRGADLVLYCSVIVMIVGFLMIYSRLRAVRRDLTLLVRRLAVTEAATTTSTPPQESPKKTDDKQPED
ncbi:unnamed protein product [marine sediment metagenome]|uniref:DUF2304 domain-containing protein n=1 Tax=marine sediment metagenome TaxID=412755 RepID=X0XNC0_9ZZZZ